MCRELARGAALILVSDDVDQGVILMLSWMLRPVRRPLRSVATAGWLAGARDGEWLAWVTAFTAGADRPSS